MPDTALSDDDVLTSAFYTSNVRQQVVAQVTSATRPTGVDGRLISETDTGRVARFDGTGWHYVDVTPWLSYTPSWTGLTVGNGTTVGVLYRFVGRSLEAMGRFTLGSTSAVTGGVTQTIPVGSVSFAGDGVPAGDVRYVDVGVGIMLGDITVATASSVSFGRLAVSGSNILTSALSASAPFTWVSGDTISWHYRARLA